MSDKNAFLFVYKTFLVKHMHAAITTTIPSPDFISLKKYWTYLDNRIRNGENNVNGISYQPSICKSFWHEEKANVG